MAGVKIQSLLEALPKIIKEISKYNYFISDLDITQDFTGIFIQKEMERYLTENFSFKQKYVESKEYIVDNYHNVGIDCVSWILNNMRSKIYNKFICQMTAASVNKNLGTHIIDFLNCIRVKIYI